MSGKHRVEKNRGRYVHVLVVSVLVSAVLSCFVNLLVYRNLFRQPSLSVPSDLSSLSTISFPMMRKQRKEKLLPSKIGTCVITISALNNFGFVLNTYDSIIETTPGIDCFIWYLGDVSEPTDPEQLRGLKEIRKVISTKKYFKLVTMNELAEGIDFDVHKASFMFDLVEFQTTIKPFAFKYTFKAIGAQKTIFLDNDIWVTDSLKPIENLLSRYSAVVTPHVSSPIPEDGKKQKDLDILSAGVFNFGFVSFSNTQTAHDFLTFWGERLVRYGFVDAKRSMFYDQNWGQFIPTFFDHEDYFVLRDRRYNIAYWNLHERGAGLHMKNGIPHLENPITKRDEKCGFIHFSGMSLFEAYDMDKISRHQNRFTMSDFPRIMDVFLAYIERLGNRDTLRYRRLPYGYDKFENGSEIKRWMRMVYAAAVFPNNEGKDALYEMDESAYELTLSPYLRESFQEDKRWENPFKTLPQWMMQTTQSKAVDMDGEFFYTLFEERVWDLRPDLQKAFPDPTGEHYEAFKYWFKKSAKADGFLDTLLLKEWQDAYELNKENHSKLHRRVESKNDIGVNVYGWHAGLFSIGISGKKIYLAAKAAGLPSNAIEAGMVSGGKKFTPSKNAGIELTRKAHLPVNLVVMNADCTGFFLNDYPTSMRESKYNIGYWAWELDKFDTKDMENLKEFDEVWCPSMFIKQSLESTPGYDGTVVKVLPIPYETDSSQGSSSNGLTLSPTLQTLLRGKKKKKPFAFLVVFDFQSYEERKNPVAAIRAFLEAFPIQTDPEHKYQIIIKSHSGSNEDLDKLREAGQGDPRVVFIDDLLTEADNAALHEYQDCYVSLHRSEGYGMNILESLGSGVPVIATNYSGNVDFFEEMPNWNGMCSFPIPYTLIPLKKDFGPYKKGNVWADADHHEAVLAMKKVVENNCKEKFGERIADDVVAHFGPSSVGKKMKDHLYESFPRIMSKGHFMA